MIHSFFSLGQFSNVRGPEKKSLLDIVLDVQKDENLSKIARDYHQKGLNFQERIRALQTHCNLFQQHLNNWEPIQIEQKTENELDQAYQEGCQQLAGVSMQAFYLTRPACSDFFLLHGVTSSYAVIEISKHLDSRKERMRTLYFQALALLFAFVVEGSPDVVKQLQDPLHPKSPFSSWEEIFSEVLREGSVKSDVHMIKALYVCKTFANAYPVYEELGKNTAGVLASLSLLDTKDYRFYVGFPSA